MQRLFGDIAALEDLCRRVCADKEHTLVKDNRDNLIKFLNSLNEQFDTVRDQILLMDHIPSMSKAYAMFPQVERQKNMKHNIDLGAFNIDIKKGSPLKRAPDRFRSQIDKKSLICEHCKNWGHSKDFCFKLHETLEWFKDMNDKKVINANVVEENKTNVRINGSLAAGTSLDSLKVEISNLKAEMRRILEKPDESPVGFSNALVEFSSSLNSYHVVYIKTLSLLVNSGAFCHVAT